jgi:hypothetical protein
MTDAGVVSWAKMGDPATIVHANSAASFHELGHVFSFPVRPMPPGSINVEI